MLLKKYDTNSNIIWSYLYNSINLEQIDKIDMDIVNFGLVYGNSLINDIE